MFIHPVIFFPRIPRQTSALCIFLISVFFQVEGRSFWKIVYLSCINLGSLETQTNRILYTSIPRISIHLFIRRLFFFLVTMCGIQDLSSLTRDQTHSLCIGSVES